MTFRLVLSLLLLFSSSLYVSVNGNRVRMDVCYDPTHNPQYFGKNKDELANAIDKDFEFMKQYVRSVRTYNSIFNGLDLVPFAAKYGVEVYLGVWMARETGYMKEQFDSVVRSVQQFPHIVKAIFVGNENLYDGGYSANDVIQQIHTIKGRIANEAPQGNNIPVGSVQQIGDWVNNSPDVQRLADACQIIGANIYPFFDNGYKSEDPLNLFNILWVQLHERLKGVDKKLAVTETGFATGGGKAFHTHGNDGNLGESLNYYKALQNYVPPANMPMHHPIFWFAFFDRLPTDNTMGGGVEQHFGFFKWNRAPKAANFPPVVGNAGAGFSAVPAAKNAPPPEHHAPPPPETTDGGVTPDARLQTMRSSALQTDSTTGSTHHTLCHRKKDDM